MKKYIIRYLPYSCLNISDKIRNYASHTNLIVKNINVYHEDFAKETLDFYSDFLEGFKEIALKANEAANDK